MSERENKSAYLNIIASITSTIVCCNSNNNNDIHDKPKEMREKEGNGKETPKEEESSEDVKK